MTTQTPTMTFYDIASGPPVRPFAPNPWKARYALNFTHTPYQTAWVPLSEVTATRKKLGVPACRTHADGTEFLTLPVLHDHSSSSSTQQQEEEGTGTFIGDSFDIALYLHNKHSSPSNRQLPPLFPPNTIALHRSFNIHVDTLFSTHGGLLAGYYMPFDPLSASTCRAEFARRAGVARWEDLEIPLGSEQRSKSLAKFETVLGTDLAKWFVRQDEGPFLEGKEPMYADFIIAGWLQMMRVCLPEWEMLRERWQGGMWGRLFDALEEWAGVS